MNGLQLSGHVIALGNLMGWVVDGVDELADLGGFLFELVVRAFLVAREDGLVVCSKSEWEDSESSSGVGSGRLRCADAIAISLEDFMVGMMGRLQFRVCGTKCWYSYVWKGARG